MPFVKMNVKREVQKNVQKSPDFAKAYKEISQEYEIIRKIANARKGMGITQQQLANKIGVKQQVISRFESNVHAPTLDNFLRILDGLNLEISIKPRN